MDHNNRQHAALVHILRTTGLPAEFERGDGELAPNDRPKNVPLGRIQTAAQRLVGIADMFAHIEAPPREPTSRAVAAMKPEAVLACLEQVYEVGD